jgi:nitroreductase
MSPELRDAAAASSAVAVHPLIADRWSPRAIAERPVDRAQLASLFEAARWAPSSRNEQPWRFLVATRDDPVGYGRLAACLLDGNGWARRAPVLALSVAKLDLEHDGSVNRHAWHDVGLATENLVLQAWSLDLVVHQIAGFDAERARSELAVPAGFDPVAMLAIGYRDAPETLDERLRARELAPRRRRPLEELVFGPAWEAPFDGLSAAR